MATILEILTTNYDGQIADITFYPCSGGSIRIGDVTLPYEYETENYYGTYDIYLPNYNKTCSLNIPCLSPTPTPTPTNTPTPTTLYCDINYYVPVTPTPTSTPTNTPTVTQTPTNTQTQTLTPSITPTKTTTPTVTKTPGASPNPTPSITPTNTVTPTVTNTQTQTPTPTPTNSVTCNCLTFVNTSSLMLPYQYTDCDGNTINRIIHELQTITVCGTNPSSPKEVNITIGVCDNECIVDCFEYTITLSGDSNCVFEFTPCCDTEINSPYVLDPKEGSITFYSRTYPVIIEGEGIIDDNGTGCEEVCDRYEVNAAVSTTITFNPCCGELRTSPYVITNFDTLPIELCSSTTPTIDTLGSVIKIGPCPSC